MVLYGSWLSFVTRRHAVRGVTTIRRLSGQKGRPPAPRSVLRVERLETREVPALVISPTVLSTMVAPRPLR